MKKKHKNEILNMLLSMKLDVDKFELIEEGRSTEIRYKDIDFKFVMNNSPLSFDKFKFQYTQFAPGFKTTDLNPLGYYCKFEEVKDTLTDWIQNHLLEYIEELDQPDLWKEFNSGTKDLNLNTIDFENQESFSIDERAQIQLSIKELTHLIKNEIVSSDSDMSIVIDRLNYLAEASERLNKFDWKSLAMSTLISISIALSLDVDKGQLLFKLFMKVFSAIHSLTP